MQSRLVEIVLPNSATERVTDVLDEPKNPNSGVLDDASGSLWNKRYRPAARKQ